jgi:predicted small metal-binding protein
LYADSSQNMAKLRCSDYGFECDFVSEGEMEEVIEVFGKHTNEEHGIDYSKEALMQFILRQKN